MGQRLIAIAAVSGLAFTTSGCSLLYGKGRPKVSNPPTQYVTCTNVYGPIVIDGLVATLYTVGTVAAIQDGSNSTDQMESKTGQYAALFILPAIFALSGIYGAAHLNDCSKHHEAWARLHPESPNGPVPTPMIQPSYPPSYYPPQPVPMHPLPPQQPGQAQPVQPAQPGQAQPVQPLPPQQSAPTTPATPAPTTPAPAAPHK